MRRFSRTPLVPADRVRRLLATLVLTGLTVLTLSGPGSDAGGSAAAKSASPCGPAPGGGALEWRPDAHLNVLVKGVAGGFPARAGTTLYVDGVPAAGRTGFIVAIDLRTGKQLASFRPVLPPGDRVIAMAASPSALYVASGPDGPFGEGKHVQAFDADSGAALASFQPPADLQDGLLSGMVYTAGRIVITSAPPTGPGPTLGAFDAGTGAPLWRINPGYSMGSVATDGRQVFVGVRADEHVERLFDAFDVMTGEQVPSWGASLPGADADSLGVISGIAGSRLLGAAGPPPHAVSISLATGAPLPVPQLPRGATVSFGTSRTLVGSVPRTHLHGTRLYSVPGVFTGGGKLIGTTCLQFDVIAQRDDRHLIALRTSQDQRSTTIVELARP
ncbi:MAG TPA: PQQ-binding-like beta-propeller repeat protein [Solirubrobacteraceae bacterium]